MPSHKQKSPLKRRFGGFFRSNNSKNDLDTPASDQHENSSTEATNENHESDPTNLDNSFDLENASNSLNASNERQLTREKKASNMGKSSNVENPSINGTLESAASEEAMRNGKRAHVKTEPTESQEKLDNYFSKHLKLDRKSNSSYSMWKYNPETGDSEFDPGPNAIDFYCNYCKTSLPLGRVRIHCAECPDYDLCVNCACHGYSDQGHLPSHKYIPIGPNNFFLFTKNWTADEEIVLLAGIGKFGFGNWKQVSDMMYDVIGKSDMAKSPQDCETHYNEIYLRSKLAPFPDISKVELPPNSNVNGKILSGEIEKEITDYIKESNLSGDIFYKQATEPSVSHPEYLPKPWDPNLIHLSAPFTNSNGNMPTTFQGVQPFRCELEDEYDNDAEFLIKDLEFDAADTPLETQLKLRLVELYNSRLDERIFRKLKILHRAFPLHTYPSSAPTYTIFKNNWLDCFRISHRDLADENELKVAGEIAPLFRFHNKESHLKMIKLLIVRNSILKRMEKLNEWARLGLYNINDIKQFERTNVDFAHTNKGSRRFFKRSPQAGIMIDKDSLSLDPSVVFRNDFKLSEKQFESLLESISNLPKPQASYQNENFLLEPVCDATIQMTPHARNYKNDDYHSFITTQRITKSEHFEQLAPLFNDSPSDSNMRVIVYENNGFSEDYVTEVCQQFANKKLQQLKEVTQPFPLAGLSLDNKCNTEICIIKPHQSGEFRATLYKVNQADNCKDNNGYYSKRKRLIKNVSDTAEFFKTIQPQIKIKNDLIGIYYKPERASWVAETGDLPGARGKLRKILFSIHKLGFEYAYFCAVQRRAKTLWDCYFSNNPDPQVDNTVISVFEHYSLWCKAIRATKFNAPACTIMNSKLASQIALYLTENNILGIDNNINMGLQ